MKLSGSYPQRLMRSRWIAGSLRMGPMISLGAAGLMLLLGLSLFSFLSSLSFLLLSSFISLFSPETLSWKRTKTRYSTYLRSPCRVSPGINRDIYWAIILIVSPVQVFICLKKKQLGTFQAGSDIPPFNRIY